MKVYIIIVTYNPLKWIEKCLLSLRNNSVNTNIIIVDNCSNDGSQEIIKNKFPEVKFIQANENLGFGKANNLGIKMAYELGADYFFLLNQDAFVQNNTIKVLIDISLNNNDFGIISPIHLNGKGDKLDYNFSKYIQPESCENFISDIVLNNTVSQLYEIKFVNAAAWLVTRFCIEKVGGFCPIFDMYGEDNNYIQRVKYHKLKIGVAKNSFIYHDRENRDTVEFLTNQRMSFIRNIKVKYCDPNCELSMKDEIVFRQKQILKEFIKLNFNEVRRLNFEISELEKNFNQVDLMKKLSKNEGLTFLN